MNNLPAYGLIFGALGCAGAAALLTAEVWQAQRRQRYQHALLGVVTPTRGPWLFRF
jgi:hypothetical protein